MADISKIKTPDGTIYNLKDSSGNYVKKAGDTVEPNALTVTNTVGTVVQQYPSALYQSPIPKYLWHDLWAFCRATTPKFYQTTDGTTWVEKTLDKSIFAQKEAHDGILVIDETYSGSRWEWDGGGFAYCNGYWLAIGVGYESSWAKFDVLLESSSGTGDTAEWSTLLDVKNVAVVQKPVWIKTNSPTTNNLRLTITRNSSSGSDTRMKIKALKYLSARWGDQGKGSEYEYPYTWDSDGNITLLPNTTLSGTASHANQLLNARTIDGVDFNGTAAITHYGTCSTAASTANKTVSISGFKLVTGAIVWVRFTVTNSAAVGDLTLNVNGTGAKHIKYRGGNLGSVGYLAAGRTYPFVYDGTYWELACDIDTTTTIGSAIRANATVVKVGSTAIDANEIMVAGTDGLYIPLNSGNAFDTKRPIFNEGTATATGGTSSNNYYATTVAVAKTQDMTLTPYEPIYIKGHLSDTTFTPVSTTPLTQTEPTSDDGYQYMFLGIAYSATSFWLSYDHPIYAYVDGVFKEYNPIDSENIIATFTSADVAQTDATSYTDPGVLTSGETHKSIFGKISQIAKNVKYLYKMLGTTDISTMGNGTITNALSVLNDNGIKSITRSGTTFTVTRNDDTTFTFDQQDNNTWNANNTTTAGYVAAPTTSRPRYFYSTDNNGAPGWRQNITVVGASSSADGTAGLVPAPTSANYDNRTFMYLRSDGKWQYLPLANNATTTATHYALDARMGKTLDGEIAVKVSVFSDTTNGLKVGSTLNLPSISFNMVNALSICNVMSTNRMFVMTGGVISDTFRLSGVYMDADGTDPVSVGLDILFNPNTKKVTKIVKSSNWPSNVTTVGQLELFILRKTLT